MGGTKCGDIVLKYKRRTEHLWKIYGCMMTVLFLLFFVLFYLEHTSYEVEQIVASVEREQGTEQKKQKDTILQKSYKQLKQLEKKKGQFEVKKEKDGILITIESHRLFVDNKTNIQKGSLAILNDILKILKSEKKFIGSIVVLSHTMQKDESIPNEAVSDRILSATRSAKISAYIQQKKIIEPKNILSIGCGQFSPRAFGKSEQERKKNERIEIKIQKKER